MNPVNGAIRLTGHGGEPISFTVYSNASFCLKEMRVFLEEKAKESVGASQERPEDVTIEIWLSRTPLNLLKPAPITRTGKEFGPSCGDCHRQEEAYK